MPDFLIEANRAANAFVWGVPAMVAIVGVGLWLSVRTRFVQVGGFGTATLGWGLYASRCAEFTFGHRAVKPFLVLYALAAILGATVDLGLIWDAADTFNGCMAVPNLIALFLLSGKLVAICRERKDGVPANGSPKC